VKPLPDHTHAAALRSWVESANDPRTDFPIQNLPLGVFQMRGGSGGRIGTAIGEQVLDTKGAVECGLLRDLAMPIGEALGKASLNALARLGPPAWRAVRCAVSGLLSHEQPALRDDASLRSRLLLPMADVTMLLPMEIGDYTDFYASLHHATNVGSMFRPDQPLMPNWKHLPVGYHGRASSIMASGAGVRRPMGQTKADDSAAPSFGPSKLLDYELEVGCFVGPGNELGTRIEMEAAADHLFGLVLVNDWSVRDVQKWEYMPLGPFNAKNFATTISPWVVTLDALAPYLVAGPPRSADDPQTLPYLNPVDDLAVDLTLEVRLQSETMRERGMEPALVSRGSFRDMYWTLAQMLVHHTSTGCNLRPGDLIASGTVSGPTEESRGCLLERAWRGERPFTLPDGTQRKFLLDGDEVIMRGWCKREGTARIGFGECRGVVLPVR
jgi:fumarylacetoacetase